MSATFPSSYYFLNDRDRRTGQIVIDLEREFPQNAAILDNLQKDCMPSIPRPRPRVDTVKKKKSLFDLLASFFDY